MSNFYQRPDVYVERVATDMAPVVPVGTGIAAFVGEAKYGEYDTPTLCYSWDDYVNAFAKGLPTPFDGNDLAYAVYLFFAEGGFACYVVRVKGTIGTASAVTEGGRTWTAKYTGLWSKSTDDGVGLQVAMDTTNGLSDVEVYLNGVLVESYVQVATADLNTTITNASSYLVVTGSAPLVDIGTLGTSVGAANLLAGADDTAAGDSDFIAAITVNDSVLDAIDELNMVAVPGQSLAVQNQITAYTTERGDCIAILDTVSGLTNYSAVAAVKADIDAGYAAIYYPWGNMVDPVSGESVLVSPSGAVCGVISLRDVTRGIHIPPAGTDCQIRSFTSMERRIGLKEQGTLNMLNVNTIVHKKNIGNCIAGGRLVTPNLDRVYVSDLRLDMYIEESLQEGLQWAVYQLSNEVLWAKIVSQVSNFLTLQWKAGALKGSSPSLAFTVKCDATLNTSDVMDAGQVITEVGWAKNKPGEFIIIKVRNIR
jgi:phage tail sheath protein FI